MTPMLAFAVALVPFAALIGPLVWMARASGRPAQAFPEPKTWEVPVPVRTVFSLYWLLILAGIVVWLAVGLTVE